jgi:hypothetical protein
MLICEESLSFFNNTNFFSYNSFCEEFYKLITNGFLNVSDNTLYVKLFDLLYSIYNLNSYDSRVYILNYFSLDQYDRELFEQRVIKI